MKISQTYITITFSTTISIYQMDSDDIVSQMSARYFADSTPFFLSLHTK